jgi:hypothetical protein
VARSRELGDRLPELGLVAREVRHACVALGGEQLRDREADPVAPSVITISGTTVLPRQVPCAQCWPTLLPTSGQYLDPAGQDGREEILPTLDAHVDYL